MGVPVGLVWEGLVDAVVEVLVVGEDNVSADVVELGRDSQYVVRCVFGGSGYQ